MFKWHLYPFMRGCFNDAGGGTGTGSGDQSGTGAGQDDGDKKTDKTRTFIQEEVDRIIADRLAREKEKYKDYDDFKKANDELKKLKEGQMSETEKLQTKLAEKERKESDLERELAEARLETTKLKILEELDLPKAWADRIFGTNEEELKTDAKNLAKLLGEASKGKSVGSGSNPGTGKEGDPIEEALKLAEARNKGPQQQAQGFDPWARK